MALEKCGKRYGTQGGKRHGSRPLVCGRLADHEGRHALQMTVSELLGQVKAKELE